ncbi:uncharacterized protein NEMAJ01_1635 [Nematocida major]|uniref:uncharacterized protein n=1 Tax=Nematocida major TaxID=1912982 RepID=UPI0020076D5E|nr:uncharacterized protein NEMAJ01_1635 [Nematocida major]KAH9386739.1 hypothetical protein NEMAJ01_1635 [Nematocida major]
MESVILAYNKLSVSTIASVFKEIEASYQKNSKETGNIIVKILLETDIESNLLAVSSLLKLIYSALDRSIVEEVVSSIENLSLCCYIFNYGLVDDTFINSKVSALIEKRDVLSILRILQMSSTLLDHSTLSLIESCVEEDGSFLVRFIKESVGMIKKGHSPYRSYIQEEMNSVAGTVSGILKKYAHTNTEVITAATDSDELIAVKFGMNTSLKKKIFSIVTESPDYAEAQRALYKQVIRKVWHIEEIVKVCIRLCISESAFNTYYPTLVISIYNTSSNNHKSTVIKYIYQTVDSKVETLSRLSVKEIYNLGMLLGHFYVNGINSLKPVVGGCFALKKHAVLAKVVFKSILVAHLDKKITKFRKVKENADFRRFFNSSLIDGSFLTEENRPSLHFLYGEMFIQN